MGTELRQLRMFEKEYSTSIEMEEMMTDNLRRRHFVIDADVEVREEIKRGRERDSKREIDLNERNDDGQLEETTLRY